VILTTVNIEIDIGLVVDLIRHVIKHIGVDIRYVMELIRFDIHCVMMLIGVDIHCVMLIGVDIQL